MFHLNLTKIMEQRLPKTVLRQIIGHTFGNQNVTGIPATHHPLCNVNAGAGDVCSIINVFDLIDRSAVYSHTHPNVGAVF